MISSSRTPPETDEVLGTEVMTNPDGPTDTSSKDPKLDGEVLDRSVESLIEQWVACIGELRQLAVATQSDKPIHGLSSLLKVQQRALDKAVQKRDKEQLTPAHYFGIKSCCWDDKWAVVKKCRGLVCVNRDFARSPRQPVPPGSGWLAYKDKLFQEKEVAVDAVVDSGVTWLRFMSMPAKRLEYQVLTEGYESGGDEDGETQGGLVNTEFVDSIRKLVLAARWNHCPHVHLLLPGLRRGESAVVDRVLDYVQTTLGDGDVSVTISCADSAILSDAPPPFETAIAALVRERDPLVGDDGRRVGPVANLDPSALVSLATDLHHGPVPLQPQAQQDIIAASVEAHETDKNELVSRRDILATVLLPALRGRRLVCTRFAASYFRWVIAAIGTHSEEVRASLILPPEDNAKLPSASSEDRLAEFRKWSMVPIPSDLRLPVEVVDDIGLEDIDQLISAGRLPPMAHGVGHDLSRLNRSVYLYGWANRVTTVTGHRGIERQIQLSIATHWVRGSGDERPPDIWHRHLGGYLVHRDKPKDWRHMIPGGEDTSMIPHEVIRWTYPWTTWGRGISTYGVPDTKSWEGVGHDDMQGYGRRTERRERGNNTVAAAVPAEEDEEGDFARQS